ncbi:MAG: glycoside hydrolase family 3 N-terminal domain-containing protein [Bacteroidales bacterium]|nr:glycoside hydrolase family 3 N-terminal domain-containing protein [Bacteroidales bacterium]
MKILNRTALAMLLLITMSCEPTVIKESQVRLNSEIETKVAAMLGKMTLEEKVGQMTQITLDVITRGDDPFSSYEPVELDSAMLHKAFVTYKIGSVLNTANNRARTTEVWNSLVNQIQDYAISHSPNGIPVIYGLDMIHGASYVAGATLFPQQIGLAATWNPDLAIETGKVTAYETRAAGVAWTFSPVLDLGVDPRWPRQWETFGEDPYLSAVMGHHLIKGLEGEQNDIHNPVHIASCLKHFLGYSHTLSGKDRSPAWLPENKLREYHAPSFKAGVDAGALTVMVNSGEINGLPTHINKSLLTGLLKEEWNFKGFIVTDWSDIEYLHTRHKVAENHKEAVKMAINAGIDMSMVPYNFDFADHLIALVKEGAVPMSRIDDAVTRILRVKFLLGLFDKPFTHRDDYPEFASEAHSLSARKAALESITLLKNNSILPLAKNTRILVGGPAANKMRPLNGGWSYSWLGNLTDEFATDYETIYEALSSRASKPENISLFEGVSYLNTMEYKDEVVGDLTGFKQIALKADVILLCLGENSYTEKPGDLEDLYLSDNQQELVRIAASTGKPVILLLSQGRPRLISKIEHEADAILYAYLSGNYGGEAIAKIIYGDENPSGKLPFTYPRYPNSLEPYYHKHAEALPIAGSPTGTQYNPQYPFGFGMSYATFEYDTILTDKSTYKHGEVIRLEVRLTNSSSVAGKEVIQVFSSDRFASLTPSVKRLRAFRKILLNPGESQVVKFEIPVENLAFVNLDNKWIVESGEFEFIVNSLKTSFSVE